MDQCGEPLGFNSGLPWIDLVIVARRAPGSAIKSVDLFFNPCYRTISLSQESSVCAMGQKQGDSKQHVLRLVRGGIEANLRS